MNGSVAGRVTSGNSGIAGITLGAAGGDERLHSHGHGLTQSPHNHSAGDSGHTHYVGNVGGSAAADQYWAASNNDQGPRSTGVGYANIVVYNNTISISVNANGAGNSQNMPPTLILNKIIFAGV